MDTYFVYRLVEEKQDDGSKVTDVTLLSQTIIGGKEYCSYQFNRLWLL